jgi:hypothetical protein
MENKQTGDLTITSDNNQTYLLDVGGQAVTVSQICRKMADGWSELELTVSLDVPQRFNVRVPVPADCINACAILNGQLLISWFSEEIPDGLPQAVRSGCQEHGTPYSTLRPGQPQNINFRWQNGDCLRFYWIWPR